ncbi:MAG: lytic transglycosylase domain-containing protein [Phenylobacterium sp.]|uniref:lytic transglycosylase domain-containing protein n=1 Tax=Phenylobacterium sp. TaxID=1871053 RepID=UPI00273411FF|nr:lytic transglycosylase domain-containing protein [Phenylobacterium sp.]MDP3748585.1 lytic transglycosylase domain-containing protein [Phenylobacterium sp.]
MQARNGIQVAVLAGIFAAFAQTAVAAPKVLSDSDAQRYAAAFAAVEDGDFIDAGLQAAQAKDQSLAGHLAFRQLMHPTAHTASYDELAKWLERFGDLPGAERVYTLASRRKPTDGAVLNTPLLAGFGWGAIERTAQGIAQRLPGAKGRMAREAFYAGDMKRAFELAPAAGERWIAGLAAYRLKNYDAAETHLALVARDVDEDPWLRAGAAYWAARAVAQAGDSARADQFLALAARFPTTFYGMIAERRVALGKAKLLAVADQGRYVPAAYSGPTVELARFISSDSRAHRAAALAQIGRATEAGLECRAGLTLAKTPTERSRWMELIQALNAPLTALTGPTRAVAEPDYPTPTLEPRSGFTVDKALVYAIVRQESRFNPLVVSHAGAVGLMQLMPEAAARAAGDDKLKTDMSPLFDPAFNLRVGQDYVTWLMERGVGYDILRTVAAYNGGPGTLLKTVQRVGPDADSLLIIESLPSLESRNYVEKVMAAYWTYRKKFGQESKTLDALAQGEGFIDARLDQPASQPGAPTMLAAQTD